MTEANDVYKPYPSGYGTYTNRCVSCRKKPAAQIAHLVFANASRK